MVIRTLQELVRDLDNRHRLGNLPPVVLLGAGAPIESGIEVMDGLFKLAHCDNFAQFVDHIETRDDSEQYRLLADFLQARDPAVVTPGYQALASLCAAKLFDIVLTTNLDPLIDDALPAAQLWRRDYLLTVNGLLRPDRLEPPLRSQSPRVKVLKLHGDLFHRFMACTTREGTPASATLPFCCDMPCEDGMFWSSATACGTTGSVSWYCTRVARSGTSVRALSRTGLPGWIACGR
jgi:hypothetical protein